MNLEEEREFVNKLMLALSGMLIEEARSKKALENILPKGNTTQETAKIMMQKLLDLVIEEIESKKKFNDKLEEIALLIQVNSN